MGKEGKNIPTPTPIKTADGWFLRYGDAGDPEELYRRERYLIRELEVKTAGDSMIIKNHDDAVAIAELLTLLG